MESLNLINFTSEYQNQENSVARRGGETRPFIYGYFPKSVTRKFRARNVLYLAAWRSVVKMAFFAQVSLHEIGIERVVCKGLKSTLRSLAFRHAFRTYKQNEHL